MDVLLPAGLPAAVVALDAGEDPDSFLACQGAEVFRERLAAARPALELFIEQALAGAAADIGGQARAVEMILAKLRLLPGEIERGLYLQDLARRTGLGVDLLQQKLAAEIRRPAPAARPAVTPSAPAGRPVPPRSPRPAPEPAEKSQDWLLILMIAEPAIRRRVAAEGVDNLFSGADRRAIAERILALDDGGEKIEEARLGDPLNESQNALLSGILLKDEKAFVEDPEAVFEGCRKAAGRERLKSRSRELMAQIHAAEKAGDSERIIELNRELIIINKQRK